MMSAIALVFALVCVGALLHLAWLLALAALLWAPSGYAGIVCGWHAAQLMESTSIGIAVAVAAAALTRFAILKLAAPLFPIRLIAAVAGAP